LRGFRNGDRGVAPLDPLLDPLLQRTFSTDYDLGTRDAATRFSPSSPVVWVAQLDASIRYYREPLGFRFDWTDGEPPDFASVSRGDTQIFMCQRCQGNPGTWIWMMTPDVDALYDDFVARGAIIRARPENKPWGMREMQVADPRRQRLAHRLADPRGSALALTAPRQDPDAYRLATIRYFSPIDICAHARSVSRSSS
jgi:catechol 2,3-dioxygenase-like lactoylglutathione lyase family enzyme